jgi:hypothetical protein
MHKPPAFLAHAPERVCYEALSASDNAALCQFLDETEGQLFRMQETAYEFPYGFYRFDKKGSDPCRRFWKLLPEAFYDLESFSAQLERDLNQAGVRARLLNMARGDFQGVRVCVVGSDFLEFSPWPAQPEHAARLGQYLARLHQVLKRHPFQAQCRENWLERKTGFDQVLEWVDAFSGSKLVVGELTIPKAELALFIEHYALLDFDLSDAQMVHGDLNPGNVLSLEGEPCVIDYENAHYSFFPPVFDLAMAVQRLLWKQPMNAVELLETRMCEAYGFEGDLKPAMMALSVRSMAVLLENAIFKQGPVPQREWDKFVALMRQAQNRP